LSSSSKIRTSKYSALITPAAFGLFVTPGGCQDTSDASVNPYAPLKVSIPNLDLISRSTSSGNGAAPRSRSDVLASEDPDFGISGRSTSCASR
jgi:hypothetical protein